MIKTEHIFNRKWPMDTHSSWLQLPSLVSLWTRRAHVCCRMDGWMQRASICTSQVHFQEHFRAQPHMLELVCKWQMPDVLLVLGICLLAWAHQVCIKTLTQKLPILDSRCTAAVCPTCWFNQGSIKSQLGLSAFWGYIKTTAEVSGIFYSGKLVILNNYTGAIWWL